MGLIGQTNEEKIWNYLYSKLKNNYGVAGLIGNLKAESGLSPINLQNTGNTKLGMSDEQYTNAVDNNSYTNFIKDSQGYGLAQWTYWNRKQNLLEYAKSKGVSIGDLEMQLDFLVNKELQTNYKSVWNKLLTATSVRQASDVVLTEFEKPANQSESVKVTRAKYGQESFNKFIKTTNENKEVSPLGYTNSPLVSYTQISPNRTSPRNHKIDTITIHCVVGQLTVESLGGCFASTSRSASCNYGVGKDGRIGMYCEEKDRSWCSSSAINDHRAITIEVASDTKHPYRVNDVALQSLIKLCADICKRNNIKKLVWSTNKNDRINHLNGCNMTVHRDFANKSCPGDYLYNLHGYIADEVNKKLGISTSYATTTTTTSTTSSSTSVTLQKGSTGQAVKELQENLNYLGYSCGTADGIFGTNTHNALVKFQNAYGLTAKGIYDNASKTKMSEVISKKKPSSTTTSTGSYIYNGVDYSLVFNPTYYANKYSDLKKSFGTDSKKLFEHFLNFGMREGRQAISTFDVKKYKSYYSDLQNAFGNDLKKYYDHYIKFGKKENRKAI